MHCIAVWFGDCVRTPTEIASFAFGLASLLCYVMSLFPQLWLNFRRKSVEGLSAGLLALWAFGDCCNLLGTLFTKQLATQVYVAVYFVVVDVVIVLQYLWYSSFRIRLLGLQPREGSAGLECLLPPHTGENVTLYGSIVDPVSSSQVQIHSRTSRSARSSLSYLRATVVAIALASACFLFVYGTSGMTFSSGKELVVVTDANRPRLCDERPPMTPTMVLLGCVAAWTSGMFYFLSPVPQILENHKTKRADGLSP
ncbi:PQ loop repeat-containing protein 2, partial [Cladochytrium tenue]